MSYSEILSQPNFEFGSTPDYKLPQHLVINVL